MFAQTIQKTSIIEFSDPVTQSTQPVNMRISTELGTFHSQAARSIPKFSLKQGLLEVTVSDQLHQLFSWTWILTTSFSVSAFYRHWLGIQSNRYLLISLWNLEGMWELASSIAVKPLPLSPAGTLFPALFVFLSGS